MLSVDDAMLELRTLACGYHLDFTVGRDSTYHWKSMGTAGVNTDSALFV